MPLKTELLNRRGFLLAGGAAATAAAAGALLPRSGSELAALGSAGGSAGMRVKAAPAAVPLRGPRQPEVKVWAFNGEVPGPGIRVRQGERLRVTLENGLGEDTTIHWHGVRVPNAMDGVAGLTQDPVRPGSTFTYEFAPQDAGTFWYHPHQRSFEQVGRGLYAPLIVEEKEPILVDRDLTWVLDDWRIDSTGQIGAFGNMMDAMMAGSVGNTITINGRLPGPLKVRTGERIRLRLINAANARIFGLNFGGQRPQVIAMDGQPISPHEPAGPILVGPGMRIDLLLDMMAPPGSRASITDNFYKGLEYRLADIVYATSPLRREPLAAPVRLPSNPLSEPDLRDADRNEIVFGGGMMSMVGGGGMMGGSKMGGGMMGWTINGVSARGHVHEPMLTLARGRTAVMRLKNDTAWWHPIHLHGHTFRVISRNGKPTDHREWQDTVLIPPQENADIAFVADNPGDWMLHCHVLEHQAAGMMAVFRVT